MENKRIESLYNAYIKEKTVGNRLLLEKAIQEENENAKKAFFADIPFNGTFTAYLDSERAFKIITFTETTEGNTIISENVVVKVGIYKYLRDSVTAAKLLSLESKVADGGKLLKDFFDGFITRENENGETTCSINATKKELESLFVDFGFSGHISSKNLKAAALHYARANKSLTAVKQFKLSNILSVFEMIDKANVIASAKKAQAIEDAKTILFENGYTISRDENKE